MSGRYRLSVIGYRLAFQTMQRVAPERAAAWAERLFFTPSQTRLSPEQVAILEQGHPFSLTVDGRPVRGWSWGQGPAVYLMHGWGSRGGRLGAFVAPLLAAGYRVVTHDAPGHGASDPGLTSMPEFARTLQAVVEAAGPAHGVIGHSMGASATALAMADGLEVSRTVFLAPAANPAAFATGFAALLGLSDDTIERLRARSERRLQIRWDDLDVPTMARGFSAPLLLIHDREDALVPWDNGAAIAEAWPDATLVSTSGLSHRDLVRNPGVVARAVRFISEGTLASAATEPAWSAAGLEYELFHPEERRRAIGVR